MSRMPTLYSGQCHYQIFLHCFSYFTCIPWILYFSACRVLPFITVISLPPFYIVSYFFLHNLASYSLYIFLLLMPFFVVQHI